MTQTRPFLDAIEQALQIFDDEEQAGIRPQRYPGIIRTIHANQLVMMGMLQRLLKQETQMAIDLTTITANVARQTTVNASIMALLDNVAAALAAIPPSSDPVTQKMIDDLNTTIGTNNDAIAADVVKNTPAAVPPVTPTP